MPNQKRPRSGARIGSNKAHHHSCTLYPNKTRFRDHRSAVTALHKLKTQSNRDVIPTRAYECGCGGWHLSSKEE